MRQPKQLYSANDNAPIRRRQTPFRVTPVIKPKATSSADKVISEHKKKAVLAWTAPVLAILMVGYVLLQNPDLGPLIWPAALMSACLALTAFRAKPHSRLRNISAMMLIGGTTACLAGALAQNGFALLTVELVLLTSIVALIAGWVLKSRPAGMLSVFASLGYLASLLPQLGLFTGLIDEVSQIGLAIIPLLLVGQAVLSYRLHSRTILLAVLTTAYGWLMISATDIPLSALAGIGFSIAAAHYCVGQAWMARGVFGSRVHIMFSVGLALLGAYYIQSFWMSAETGQAKPFWPPNNFWWAAFGISIFALFTACLARYKSSQISLIGIFAISFAAVVLPLATAKPDFVYQAFAYVPGLEASPGLGLIIGASIIAFGLIWIVKGLKENRLLDVLIGTAAIGIEGLILYSPDRLNMDFGVVFLVSLIFALCIGGLIAGSTADQNLA